MAAKASPEATGEAFSLLEAEEPPGLGPPLHVHHDAAEAFYVLEGEYLMFLGREEVVCSAGSFIYIPTGTPHGFRVGNVVSRKLNFCTPAAMVGYFDDLAEAMRGRTTPPPSPCPRSRAGTRWRCSDRCPTATRSFSRPRSGQAKTAPALVFPAPVLDHLVAGFAA
ncbi:MAG: cupin domain-containing protein [Nitriliruptorales bacterium]